MPAWNLMCSDIGNPNLAEIQPKRANSNQRLYRRMDVETILQIKSLLHEQEFTISGAKKFLKESGKRNRN